MCEMALAFIRNSIKSNDIAFSQHAVQRMLEREIKEEWVWRCLRNGKLDKVQDLAEKDRQLIFYDEEGDFCVVIAACLPCQVVTVYRKNE